MVRQSPLYATWTHSCSILLIPVLRKITLPHPHEQLRSSVHAHFATQQAKPNEKEHPHCLKSTVWFSNMFNGSEGTWITNIDRIQTLPVIFTTGARIIFHVNANITTVAIPLSGGRWNSWPCICMINHQCPLVEQAKSQKSGGSSQTWTDQCSLPVCLKPLRCR